MQTIIVKNNIVENIIVATFEEAKVAYPNSDYFDGDLHQCGVGWTWDGSKFIAPPELQPTPEQIQTQNKTQARALLQATDWVELPSVSDPTSTPHLTNVTAFLAYRSAVRAIAINPPSEPIVDWPVTPDEIWVNS